MTTLLLSLLAFAAWTLTLVTAVFLWRGVTILRGERKINEFPSGEQHGSSAYWRLNRAHLNSAENLGLFTAVTVVGVSLGQATLASLPSALLAAKVVPVARVVQSLVQISSGSQLAVALRFTAFAVQVMAIFWMGVMFVSVLL